MRALEILSTLSLILFYTAIPLLLPLGYAYYYAEPTLQPIAIVIFIMMFPSIPVILSGIFKWLAGGINTLIQKLFRREAPWNFAVEVFTRRPELSKLKFGDILAVAALAWIVIPSITAYPYYMSGLSIEDSLFESVSGWTSTGLSILSAPEEMSPSLVLFRSVTQWVGGLGIILLMLSLFKHRQAKSLLAFEAKDSMELGTGNTAAKIWKIYIFLTILAIAALILSGFDLLTASNLGFSGLSNGGFFPFSSFPFLWIQKLILALTMFFGAISFMTYNKLQAGKLNALLGEEFLLFLALIIISVSLIFFIANDEIFNSILNTVSAIACGGFAIGDLSVMHEFSLYILILLMICGGMYGSTAGGIKLWRILVALKLVLTKIRQYFMPIGSVQVVKVDGSTVEDHTITEVLGFMFMYLLLFVICAGVFMAWDYGIVDSMFTVASAMGNVGLSTINMATLPIFSKYFLIIIMYVGRIEIFPVLALLRLMVGRN
ncbi:MAG: potassium transporter TrkG [Candidatus Micrarchaeota archaeon]